MLEKFIALWLYFFCIVVFVICGCIYIPLIFIFGPRESTWFRRIYGKLMIIATFNKLIIINGPPKYDKSYLFIANHQSMFDGFMLATAIPCHFSAIAKKEAFSIPLFGFIIKHLGIIPIDRKNHQNSMLGIDQAVEKIKSGTSIIIFPEGTRTKDGQVGSFKKGAFKLALDAKATIVPVGIIGSYDSQPTGNWIIRPGVLKINFGKPIYYDQYQELSINQLSEKIKQEIIQLSSNP